MDDAAAHVSSRRRRWESKVTSSLYISSMTESLNDPNGGTCSVLVQASGHTLCAGDRMGPSVASDHSAKTPLTQSLSIISRQ